MGVGGAGRASVAAGLRVGWRLAGQRGSMDSAGDRVGGDRGLWEDELALSPGSETPQGQGNPLNNPLRVPGMHGQKRDSEISRGL